MNGTTPSRLSPHPPGFRARRGLNWTALGLMYASYYLCRYNFRWAGPDIRDQYHLDYSQITFITGCWAWAYGIGQWINGLLADRMGGKKAMLIGAVGTIIANVAFGAVSTVGNLAIFTWIWAANGYVQSFGAPGMIKINAAWFTRVERGTFSGIFGFMIQLGQVGINGLAPALLAGFTIGLWIVPPLHWKWLFWIPPMFVGVFAVLMIIFVKETPEQAGFPDAGAATASSPHVQETPGQAEFSGVAVSENEGGDSDVRASIGESLLTILKHPLVWFYALAYFCTGAVRHGSDQLAVLYFVDELKLSRDNPAMVHTLALMPVVAIAGSIAAGFLSDKVFKGHRAPVAMSLYLLESAVILTAVLLIEWLGVKSVSWSCLFLVLISLTANSTHSIVGSAAPMDIGGRRMSGFAGGVIDSFQYFGSAIAVPLMGKLLDKYGWGTWFPTMAGFGLIGGFAMWLVIRKQRLLARQQTSVPPSKE